MAYSENWQVFPFGYTTHGVYSVADETTMKAIAEALGMQTVEKTFDVTSGITVTATCIKYANQSISFVKNNFYEFSIYFIDEDGNVREERSGNNIPTTVSAYVLSPSENAAKSVGFGADGNNAIFVFFEAEDVITKDTKRCVFVRDTNNFYSHDVVDCEEYRNFTNQKQAKTNFSLSRGGYVQLVLDVCTRGDYIYKFKNLYFSIADYSTEEKAIQISGRKFQSLGNTNYYIPL